MRKIIFIIMTLCSISFGLQAQSYYKAFGSQRPNWILIIQVFDSETREPINNATVTMKSQMFDYPETFRTSNGTIVLIFNELWDKNWRNIEGEVTHPNYAFKFFLVSQSDYENDFYRRILQVPKFVGMPLSSEIAEELRMRRYSVYSTNVNVFGPGRPIWCTEQKLEMNKINLGNQDNNEREQHSRNQENNRNSNYSNEDRNNQNPSEKLIECQECQGTGKCADCKGLGRIYKSNSISYSICRYCGATGKCPNCGGRGKIVKYLR